MARSKKVTVDSETLAALQAFAAQHGEQWKDKLLTAWIRGDYSVGHVLYVARTRYGSAVFTALDSK